MKTRLVTDVLASKDVTHIHFAALEADPAAPCHCDRLVVKGMYKSIATLVVTVGALATFGLQPHAPGGKDRTEVATFSTLPSLRGGGPSEALGINDAGTVIVGSSWDQYDALRAVNRTCAVWRPRMKKSEHLAMTQENRQ